ncbi:MAG: phosphotransferase enzyme family protein, partial [Woeseiales bacterium]
VFPDPVAIMENVARVTAHVQSKAAKCQVLERQSNLHVISTYDGNAYYRDSDREYWRLWPHIENATTIDTVQSAKQAYIAGSAFGAFQVLMHDLPAPRLLETIPNFHNTIERFAQFSTSLSEDTGDRAKRCAPEIEIALVNEANAGVLNRMHESGELPERVVHNDAKINNVMLDDATGEAVCVIDLDTVMPGLALFDFGDLVRTATASAAEDQDGATIQLTWYAQLVDGYLKHTASFLNEAEVELLPLAGRIITLETGLRFLTDYLSGDTYFKTDRADHNLTRCRSQFSLLASIDQQFSQMQEITAAAYAKLNEQ